MMIMQSRLRVTVILLFLSVLVLEGKRIDPYKILGVERNASQHDIQKAFHKLSLQYHPDKNKNKDAQDKFANINNAYEILSDKEKRKNYDLYEEERGSPTFDGHPGAQGGSRYTYTSSERGPNGFKFRPGEWKKSSKSFSFSFGGVGMDDVFSSFFGDDINSDPFGGLGDSTMSRTGSRSSLANLRAIDSKIFKSDIAGHGMTWLLLSHFPALKQREYYGSLIQEVGNSLQGALKIGSINCGIETLFCKKYDIQPQQTPRIFVYSYPMKGKGSLVEYHGDLNSRSLKKFCLKHLPKISTRIDTKHIDMFHRGSEKLPRVLLLSSKKDTPAIWCVLSGLYHKRLTFNDAEVSDFKDPMLKKLGVDSLPAIVGWFSTGEKHVLKTGIHVKDLDSAITDLSILLDGFEKRSKKSSRNHVEKTREHSSEKTVPHLARSNFNALCGETIPVCFIGVFKSSKSKSSLESILSTISQKSISRRQNVAYKTENWVTYALLDAATQSAFLYAFDSSAFHSSDEVLLAYKPRRGKFAALDLDGKLTLAEAERFISSVLSGDVPFSSTRSKPNPR